MKSYCKGKPATFRQAFIKFALRVNVYHRVHVIYCEDGQEFVSKLFNISADQGIKIHKFIKRSHLPYVSDISIKKGDNLTDTYKKMLSQNYKFTRPVVDAVCDTKPTLNQLMSSYAAIGDPQERELLFAPVMVRRYREEGQSSTTMNISLSRRLYKTSFGTDPLAFVGPDTAVNKYR
ncbi:hypothetical protein CPB86DRAFT_706260 [Serendipita vermifera]|nr:hypothetical protein CPB86DRAFT_706260 [Serendipita vermifera]